MRIDAQKVKNNLTTEQVVTLLKSLGSNYIIDKGNSNNIIFQTVCHNKCQGSYKLYYYSDSHLFHCYTQCGDSFDIYELIQRNLNVDFKESLSYLIDTLNLENKISQGFYAVDNKISDWDLIEKYIVNYQEETKPELKNYNSNVLDLFSPCEYSGWVIEGIGLQTMQNYNIKYDVLNNKIIIPHYDKDNNLIGIRSRNLNPEEAAKRKYSPLIVEDTMYNHPTQYNLYGLNKTKEAIKRSKKILIWEAEKSVMKADTLYGDNNFTVATCGSNISNYQVNMILSLGVKEVFIAFDKQFQDIESKECQIEKELYIQKIFKLGLKFTKYVTTWVLWDDYKLLDYKDSPIDKGKEVLEFLMKNKQEVFCKI
jgi:hypothetical protein